MLDHNTEVELVAIKGNRCIKKLMPLAQAMKTPRVKGWEYWIYQKGFCTIKETK